MTPKRLQLLPLDAIAFAPLYDIVLLNRVNDFNYIARRQNVDAANFNRILDDLAGLLLSGQISQDTFRQNMIANNDAMGELKAAFRSFLDNEVLNLCAYVRICANNDATPEMTRRFRRMTRGRKPITDVDVTRVRNQIIKELDEQEAADRKARRL